MLPRKRKWDETDDENPNRFKKSKIDESNKMRDEVPIKKTKKVKTGYNITDVPPELLCIIITFMVDNVNLDFFPNYRKVCALFACNQLFWKYHLHHEYIIPLFKNYTASISKLPPDVFNMIWRVKLYIDNVPVWKNGAVNKLLPNIEHAEFSRMFERYVDTRYDVMEKNIHNIIFSNNIKSISLDAKYDVGVILSMLVIRGYVGKDIGYHGNLSNISISASSYTMIKEDSKKIRRRLAARYGSYKNWTVPEKIIAFMTMTNIKLDLNYNAHDSDITWIADLAKADALSSLTLSVDYSVDIKLAFALSKNTSLTSLNLSYAQITDEFITAMLPTSTTFGRNLTKLNLERNNIGNIGATAIAKALRFNHTLKWLSLYTNNIGETGATAIANALKENENLVVLNFGNNDAGAEGCRAFANMLTQNKTLFHLHLGINKIDDGGAIEIANALKENNTLGVLHLNNNEIKCAGATAIANALTKNNTLLALYLSDNDIGVAGATSFANALKKNTMLSELSLGNTHDGAGGAIKIAEALKENTTLRKLELDHNNIGNNGANKIAEAIYVNKTLKELSLQGNDIGNKGGMKLADAMKRNRTLTSLLLEFNQINPSTIKLIDDFLDNNIAKAPTSNKSIVKI